jgi:outer membrane protein assembly factor BamB
MRLLTALAIVGLGLATFARSAHADARGWLDWRGPAQNGTSTETNLPNTAQPGGPNNLWTIDIGGGGTPIIANGRVYALGYKGEGPELQEILFCADAETGKLLWERRFNDFLSDITYDRYAIGSPTVDPETGNVYALTSAGVFACFTADGAPVFIHSLMEKLGRLTFTNGRTGGPMIEDDLVIVRGITSNWGAEGAAQDRLYAFDKKTGALVWGSSPGGPPKDPSFARPWAAWRGSKRVLYTGSGDGSLVCVNARTGEPIWRFPVSAGGMNASVLLYKGMVIGIHADENLDSSDSGRMVAVRADAEPKKVEGLPPQLEASAEVWRNGLSSISSSPVLVNNRIYQVNKTGDLCAVDADTGRILWTHKLGPDQLHASPLYADGKLYVPIQNGMFFILRLREDGVDELSRAQLAGRCIGAPSAYNGKIYVFSTEKLYCFGTPGNNASAPAAWPRPERRQPGPLAGLQIIPAEVLLRPGEKATFTVRGIDADGLPTGKVYNSSEVQWASYIPPTARVRSTLEATFSPAGELVASSEQKPSAGAFQATADGVHGYARGRILTALPLTEDFEGYSLAETLPAEPNVKFAYPPLPWIGARFKFDVRELEGSKVLAKTLDNIFFQRATVFIGHPDERNYTIEADVRSDGNRRTMSSVGVINQRYLVTLEGNAQQLIVSSNQERIRVGVPFPWTTNTWYRLKVRVDVAPDGSGVVRAKAWKKGDPEPEAWTVEVPHRVAHDRGAPGLYGFSPQSLFRCYIDNIRVTPNS